MVRTALLLALLPAGGAGAAGIEPWPLPSGDAAAAQPSLAAGDDGQVHLSWIAPQADGSHRLQLARAGADGAFGAVRTIAQGRDWFVNWADFPGLLVHGDGRMASFLLLRSGAQPHAYDLALLRSTDGGASWTAPVPVHEDGTATEHGFAALWPDADGALGMAWLDGRNTAGGHEHAHGGGTMTLRAAVFGDRGKQQEWVLDQATCDCCQTDAAGTGDGVVLAYRDRSEGEVRDIVLLRKRHGARQWEAPVLVHADGWVMPACPVNGPAVAADGARVAVAWYTEAGERPRVQLAVSDDGGRRFAAPRVLAEGAAVLGRVDLAVAGNAVLASWLEEHAAGQELHLARVTDQDVHRHRVATLAARGRASGFPRLVVQGGQAWLAWTDVADGTPHLRGARLPIAP